MAGGPPKLKRLGLTTAPLHPPPPPFPLPPNTALAVAAGILRPYISREAHWLLAHHEVFQGLYYFEHCGLDPERRQAWRETGAGAGLHMGAAPGRAWRKCAEFCEEWDQASFDPAYSSMELSEFVPAMERVFSRDAFWDDPDSPKAGAVTGGSPDAAPAIGQTVPVLADGLRQQ